ncbi:MAG: TetR/AcrR family transcriptional regulator [Candidatus Kryptoniota bacterium]
MVKENDLRQAILESSCRKFTSYGYKRVTVQEIASDLGISKKTIYRFFNSKDDILREIVVARVNSLLETLRSIQNGKRFAIDKIELISEAVGKHINEQWQRILMEVRTNAPGLFKEIEAILQTKVATAWQSMFIEGQKKGWIRKDIDPVVFTTAYVGVVRELMKVDFLSKHSLTESEVPKQVFKIFTEGILTEKGRRR